MGVGQIRPVVKCRAPHRAVRRIPRGKGEKRREVPLPPRDCAAPLPTTRRGRPRGRRLRRVLRPNEGTLQSFASPLPGDSPILHGEGRAPPHATARKRPRTAPRHRKSPFPRGKNARPASAPGEKHGSRLFFSGACGRWARQKVALQQAGITEQSPRLPGRRTGFFLPIGSEWLTTGAWTPCEP